jgi:DNA-binding NarL/FixJ family response regulator
VNKLRVLLADDHPIVRGGLKALIAGQPDMEVVAEAADGYAAVRQAVDLRPDVAVVDLSMPGLSGANATEQILRAAPEVRVLALTAHQDRGYLQLVLKAGAAGYVLKQAAGEDLVRAIRAVAAGQTYLDPAVAGQLVAGLVGRPEAGPVGTGADLSDREMEVLRLIAQGHALKQIAAALDVSARTVETYRARALEKLGLRNRSDIVRYAIQRGWLSDT